MAGSDMADEEAASDVADVSGVPETIISDADADALVTEAVRKREEQQSGRLMRRQLRPVVRGTVVGLLLAAAGGFLRPMLALAVGHFLARIVADLAVIAGVLILGITGLLLLRALDLSPAAQWGDPVGEPCPDCGEYSLREDRVAVTEANGIVALCGLECGYADVRTDPDGTPEPSGGGNLLSLIAQAAARQRRGR